MALRPSLCAGLFLAVVLALLAVTILSTGGVIELPDLPAPRIDPPIGPERSAPEPLAAPPVAASDPEPEPAPEPAAAAPDVRPVPRSDPTPAPVPVAPAPAKIHGSVLDPASRPVSGARVVLSHPLGELAVLTDGHGHFRFTPLPPGTYVVRAFHADFAPQVEKGYGKTVHVAEGESRHVSLGLDPGVLIEGVVVARDGTGPVRGARVTMVRHEYRRFLSVLTRPDGTFRFPHFPVLPPGERPFPIEVTAEGFAPAYLAVEPQPEQQASRLEIRLDRGAAIRGVVSDVHGVPLAGVDIRCKFRYLYVKRFSEITTRTDNLGRYHVKHLPRAFSVQVWAFKKGYRATYLNLILSDRVTEKQMRPLRLLRERR